MYAWEPSFTTKLLNIRSKEMVYLKKVCMVTAFSVLFSVHSPFLASIANSCLVDSLID